MNRNSIAVVASITGAVSVVALLASVNNSQLVLFVAALFGVEIVAALWAYVWYESELVRLRRQLEITEAERDSAVQAAGTDPLTGLFNRRGVSLLVQKVFGTQMRFSRDGSENQTWVAVAIIDLDGFKAVNDTFGHSVGDQVICLAAALLSKYFARGTDIVSRLGGDEFLIFFTNNDDTASIVLRLEEFRKNFATEVGHLLSERLNVTASCGVAASLISSGEMNPNNLIERADKLMYLAKQEGKNRVVRLIEKP